MTIDFKIIAFDQRGLIPVIVQDWVSSEVLMMAYANREALELTQKTGYMHFFSRSRNCIWEKGETSGNTMLLKEMKLDCDGDTFLAKVKIEGPACHTGKRSCFFRTFLGSETPSVSFLKELKVYLEQRQNSDPETSYTAQLFQKGIKEISKKIGEEGVESALAIASGNRRDSVYEISDLVYHLLTGMIVSDIEIEEIIQELQKRHKTSGIRSKK